MQYKEQVDVIRKAKKIVKVLMAIHIRLYFSWLISLITGICWIIYISNIAGKRILEL